MSGPSEHRGLDDFIAGETAISGIAGAVQYRGYALESLAEHGSFEEVAYLVLHGELPNRDQLAGFRKRLRPAGVVHSAIIDLVWTIPRDVPVIDVMRTGASILAHWDPDVAENQRAANLHKAERLVAQLPILVAARHRLCEGKDPIPPDSRRSLAANLLWMLSGEEPRDRWVRAMDVSLIVCADHELSASTFAARVTASTQSDLHSAVTSAIGTARGPCEAGGMERISEIFEAVGAADRAEAWVRESLASKRRIMGFGHRVHKEHDPRAVYLKKLCRELATETGNQNMEATARAVEEAVWRQKHLPPNVYWNLARLYHYLGLPSELYPSLFVAGRIVGWCAHAIEQLDNNRMIRPRAAYTGARPRAWRPIEER
ncbi:MAG: citrate/2-methylcitrate synthase [Pirellulales bacterium]